MKEAIIDSSANNDPLSLQFIASRAEKLRQDSGLADTTIRWRQNMILCLAKPFRILTTHAEKILSFGPAYLGS